jgi:Na+/H+-dicarboxylate symporter
MNVESKKKKYPVWLKILIGMFLGILWGIIASKTNLVEFTTDWVKPWGTIFIKLLKLIAVPIIFISLVKGITSVTDITKLSRIGFKTLALYVLTTALTVVFGLIVVNTFKPGDAFSEAKKKELQEAFAKNVTEKQDVAGDVTGQSPLFFFEDMVPDNITKAAGDNSKMLQIIFFAVLFSIAMILLKTAQVEVVAKLVDNVNDIFLKIVDLIMGFAPIGVFALISTLVADFAGDAQLFVALGKYAVITFLGIIAILVIFYPAMIFLFTKTKVMDFMRAMFPAQLVAFSTSSSAATLPVTIKQCVTQLKISEGVANFCLPVGVTINMNGSSFYQAVSAVFIAQVFGLELSLMQQLTIVLTATLASIGAPGVPGGAVIMLVIVLGSVGIPAEGLALILGIERPLDMIRTVANVTGDAAVTTIIEYGESKRVTA